MTVVVVNKSSINMNTQHNVSSIAVSNGNYVLSFSDGTAQKSYSMETNHIYIIW